ncbi:small multidrug resistance protein [Gloeobacter kilaueensis]|uniref:Small multidrug resistance protein n=1 Tax=Gloeobacter kilaueensis (strain ATCC BAA-2537 / CCAP 1431/1 / ULC 316 / JS1) TaxID=1183438 RepID=U5QCV4_GLOK1|nr:small multidrug resistance protein [Gloeobacter kilaueensis]AGY56711.1 small multidrug resistance protein [Gloeobacter kilaueensis JS1]
MSSATFILILAVVLNALGNVLIKVGMNQAGPLDLTQPLRTMAAIFLNPGVAFGIGFFVVALAGYSYTLARLNLSTAYPIMSSLSFMAVLLISVVFLQERVQLVQLAGCAVILLGVWLVASQMGPTPAPPVKTAASTLPEVR